MEFKIYFILSFLCISILSSIHANSKGFTVNLIHRDSPNSPLYKKEESHFDRLRNSINRSITRGNYLKVVKRGSSIGLPIGEMQSKVISNGGEYIMSVSIGTPVVEILALIDTGSDLIWTQCKPCKQCYKQVSPIFDPEGSSTYANLPCNSKTCRDFRRVHCGSDGSCQYAMRYGDNSFSNGNLASETLTMASSGNQSIAFPRTVFGCGHENNGNNFEESTMGIVGFGGGPLSLITQLDTEVEGKFSYCLLPYTVNSASKLSFGNEAIVSGEGVVSTPLVVIKPNNFYHLTLEGISVGDKKIEYKSKVNAFGGSNKNNIIIDSGTTMTMLPTHFYHELETSIKEAIDIEPLEDHRKILKLCYQTSQHGYDFNPPILTFHFTNANLVLKPGNTFFEVEENVVCLTIIPSDVTSILGYIAQIDFLVGYDLRNKIISFKPTDCTKH